MRVLLISGSHSRNLALAKKIYVNKKVKIVGYIIFKREEMVPKPRSSLNNNLKKLWKIHFKKRLLSEKKHYDSKNNFIKKIKNKLIIRNISDFNGDKVTKFVKSLKIDSCFTQGCPIIKDPLYSLLPKYTVNLHIGLIPFYKGSITAFWPFYFLQPSMLGTTYHIIRKNVDTGEIIHQNTPKLDYGDNLHDASCKALLSGISDINLAIKEISYRIKKNIKIKPDYSLKKKGRLFNKKDWKPEMLKRIYLRYNDKIVDLYLDGKIKSPTPRLIKIKKR